MHRMNWQQGPHLHQAPCRTPLQLLGGHEPPTKSMWTAPMQTAGEPECASPCRPPPPFVEAQLAFASSTAPLATPLAMLETSARRTPAAAAPPSLASSVGPSPAAARPSPAAARPSPAPPGPLLPSPTLDMIAAQTWIYPTNLPLRPYQHSIARCALLHNTLVSLPTGMGKTLIASVVMYNLSRWFPSSRLAFLAPTKPLVHQQIRALRKCVGVQGNLCAELTGNQKSAERSRLWRSCRFFFLTPQESHALYFSAFLCPFFHLSHIFPLFITAMFFPICRHSTMTSRVALVPRKSSRSVSHPVSHPGSHPIPRPASHLISRAVSRPVFAFVTHHFSHSSHPIFPICLPPQCLVVDEAHKAMGQHAYVLAVQRLAARNGGFRILGLSATPGTNAAALQQVVTSLRIERLEVRHEDSVDVVGTMHERAMETKEVCTTALFDAARHAVLATYRALLNQASLTPHFPHMSHLIFPICKMYHRHLNLLFCSSPRSARCSLTNATRIASNSTRSSSGCSALRRIRRSTCFATRSSEPKPPLNHPHSITFNQPPPINESSPPGLLSPSAARHRLLCRHGARADVMPRLCIGARALPARNGELLRGARQGQKEGRAGRAPQEKGARAALRLAAME